MRIASAIPAPSWRRKLSHMIPLNTPPCSSAREARRTHERRFGSSPERVGAVTGLHLQARVAYPRLFAGGATRYHEIGPAGVQGQLGRPHPPRAHRAGTARHHHAPVPRPAGGDPGGLGAPGGQAVEPVQRPVVIRAQDRDRSLHPPHHRRGLFAMRGAVVPAIACPAFCRGRREPRPAPAPSPRPSQPPPGARHPRRERRRRSAASTRFVGSQCAYHWSVVVGLLWPSWAATYVSAPRREQQRREGVDGASGARWTCCRRAIAC